MMRYIYLLVVVGILSGGCMSPQHRPQSTADRLRGATIMEKNQQWEDALRAYKDVQAQSDRSEQQREQARRGAARCLMHMAEYTAALAHLMPWPEDTTAPEARRRLALGAEIALRMKEWERAETLAEVALVDASPEGPEQLWEMFCCANLARAYLENGKLSKAARMYAAAASGLEKAGEQKTAHHCRSMVQSIRRHLELTSDGDR